MRISEDTLYLCIEVRACVHACVRMWVHVMFKGHRKRRIEFQQQTLHVFSSFDLY